MTTGQIYIAIRPVSTAALANAYTIITSARATSDPSSLSTISAYGLAHWMVIIKRGDSLVGIGTCEKFELVTTPTGAVDIVDFPHGDWDTNSVAACQGVCVGTTEMGFSKITQIYLSPSSKSNQVPTIAGGNILMIICAIFLSRDTLHWDKSISTGVDLGRDWGPYDPLKNNCQNFAVKLVDAICRERSFGWLSVACPDYQTRFAFYLWPRKMRLEVEDDDVPTKFGQMAIRKSYMHPTLERWQGSIVDSTQASPEALNADPIHRDTLTPVVFNQQK
ncbi:hypothetical protein C8R43DRAFT_1108982 [Mycena crocata]|nr:hypothetical protein C8R43DRAFT_1108982 [Mycena crocata]